MSHVDEQELVMHALGDSGDAAAVRRHLEECEECRGRLAEIERLLAATSKLEVPEPDAGFEARVWARQRAALREAGGPLAPEDGADAGATTEGGSNGGAEVLSFWSPRRLAPLAAVAALVVVAFLAGLYNSPPGTEIVPEGTAPPSSDRVLFVAVGDHLASARMVLVELSNTEGDGAVDISTQRQRAQTLLADNRLYRQSAQLQGRADVADVLDQLERVLLEVARTSGEVPGEELAWLRERIADRDLLFKVNVIEAQTRNAARPAGDSGDVL